MRIYVNAYMEAGFMLRQKIQNLQTRLNLRRGLWRVFFALCMLLPLAAYAQVDQGAITGIVQDSSGAIVPNASVTVTNLDTGLALQGKTNASGVYVFSPLEIGNYKVSASAPGFRTTT